jgi:ATP-dependent RNA helicase SUPV3L1/SUV3
MSALPTRRSSLCLFCVITAARPRPQHLRLPHVQVARHTGGQASKSYKPVKHLPFNVNSKPDKFAPGDTKSFKIHKYRSDTTNTFDTIRTNLEQLRQEFSDPKFLESLSLTRSEFDEQWEKFDRSINVLVKRGSQELLTLARKAGGRGAKTLETRLRYMFYAQACGGRYTQAELDNQTQVADLRFPTEWYPATREICRTVHLHVGPTNSGKTYQALKRLEEADTGIYLGPLRLLAHEVYTRLNAKGKPCALVTGEEQRLPEGETKMWSCTVEMAPLNTRMEVAVIDEIQMINHPDRGWAWTQAFLGLQAKEIHLCGEARTVPLIRELCALIGDKVHVHEYERLTPLKVAPRSLGSLSKLEKGDCVVSFSVIGIHALRKTIETKTGRKCAIVYGSLPPETRAQQARLFNDPDNDYDFLVASDAIGMGLNLYVSYFMITKNSADRL